LEDAWSTGASAPETRDFNTGGRILPGRLLLGGDALLFLGRILRARLAERTLVDLAAAASAISLTHEKDSRSTF